MTKTALKEKKENTTKINSMFIVKVKINKDNTASIYYRTSTDSSAQEVYYSGKDEVTESFNTAFQDTVNGLIGVLPILSKEKQKIKMGAIKFDYDKNEYLKSALYSAQYAFNDQNNAVINLNTPPLPIYKEGMENTFTISGKDEDALHIVIKKAKDYINGDTRTKQGKLELAVDNTADFRESEWAKRTKLVTSKAPIECEQIEKFAKRNKGAGEPNNPRPGE